MKKLKEQEIKSQLMKTPEWSVNPKGQIERQFEFKSFKESIFFVNAVAFLAEKLDHHPDILILWNKVKLALNTHTVSGITELDFKLARLIDETLKK